MFFFSTNLREWAMLTELGAFFEEHLFELFNSDSLRDSLEDCHFLVVSVNDLDRSIVCHLMMMTI